MARYRTVKPEFWTSEQVMECSLACRLMFIGMWNYADDHGRLPLSAKSIKAQIFPSDDISFENILRMIDELSSNGLVRKYVVDGKEYLLITGWHHQKIDRPQKPKYPDPPEDSTNDRRAFAPEKKGIEGSRIEPEANASGADAPPDPAIAEREFFARGKSILGKSSGGQLAKLLKAKGGNVALARAALETASTKGKPSEYVAACCRDGPVTKPLTEFQRKQQETNDVRAELRNFGKGSASGGALDRLLPDDHGQRSEGLRGGLGPTVIAIPGASGGRGH